MACQNQSRRVRFSMCVFSLLLSLINFSFAEPVTSSFQKIPLAVQWKVCEVLSVYDDAQCDAKHPIFFKNVQKLDDNKLVIFLSLGNSSIIRQVAVTLDQYGHWRVGSSFDGVPEKEIVTDGHGNYWLPIQFYNEGTSPGLYYSRDGANWDYVNLPEERQRGSTIEYLKALCYADNNVFITLNTEIEIPRNKTVVSSWKVSSADFLARQKRGLDDKDLISVVWHPVVNEVVERLKCNKAIVNDNSWVIQQNKAKTQTRTLLRHIKKNLSILIDHKIIVSRKKPVRVANKVVPHFAIQVGVYRNKVFANELIKNLKKEGFRVFIREFSINGQRMTKIYTGPYWNERFARRGLIHLKKIFAANQPIQAAFVVRI